MDVDVDVETELVAVGSIGIHLICQISTLLLCPPNKEKLDRYREDGENSQLPTQTYLTFPT